MRRMASIFLFITMAIAPMAAWANPASSSPEPEFWAFLLMGALPMAALAYKQLRAGSEEVAVVRGTESSNR